MVLQTWWKHKCAHWGFLFLIWFLGFVSSWDNLGSAKPRLLNTPCHSKIFNLQAQTLMSRSSNANTLLSCASLYFQLLEVDLNICHTVFKKLTYFNTYLQ